MLLRAYSAFVTGLCYAHKKEVTAAIVGARNPGQIAETVQTGDWIAADEDIKKIEQLLKQRQEKINGKQ
ncbi:MAG: hypothetical protein ACYSSL_08205 [Planctomycetota bacterium]|jgi:aryl-alcohol dehydrogenase-like predicted oxidoreductase